MTAAAAPAIASSDTSHRYLAIDLGASSGRAVLGTLQGDTMYMEEVHRFRTPIVDEGGALCWDVDAIWTEIASAVSRALQIAPMLRSVSVDSWAVDYQPLDASDTPLRRPYAYRDPRTQGRLSESLARAGGATHVYGRTGIQLLEFNTLPQVVIDLDTEPELVARTATRLLIADYFLFRLSGVRVSERSMASSTQLLDVVTGEWATDLIDAIGDLPSRWPRIVASGTELGPLLAAMLPHGASHVPRVIASCSHDTACAVAAVPAEGRDGWAYVCSGTWLLIGAELNAPIATDAARMAGFTNEAGLGQTIRLLKNRTGMWVLEECLREWRDAGSPVTYEELVMEAASTRIPANTIDLDTPAFALRGDMERKISDACRALGFPAPATRGALVRLIFQSLATSCASTLDDLDMLTGGRTEVVHVVGGGAHNALLNQMIADTAGRRVVSGPAEATVLGNLLVQARTLGDLPSGISVREAARRSTRLTEFMPRGVTATAALPLGIS
ncbi:MAG: rhamnulokinase family protein [Gemmatimonadota bacterium]